MMKQFIVPPPEFIYPISHSSADGFLRSGKEVVSVLKKLNVVRNDSKVLEIGCGPGRLALNLTEYLKNGSYTGVDIIKEYIDWCSNNISRRYRNFHFIHVPIYNQVFNKKGTYKASSYTFPFPNHSFSSIILQSVFTHMLPDDVENYLSEISRLLTRNGRCYASMFIYDFKERNLLPMNCRHHFISPVKKDGRFNGAWCAVNSDPESNVAYDPDFINEMTGRNGLKIDGSIRYGQWRGGGKGLTNQDIMVLKKRPMLHVKIQRSNPAADYDAYITEWFKLRCIPTFRNVLESVSKFLIKLKSDGIKRIAVYGTGIPGIIVYLSNIYAGRPVKIVGMVSDSSGKQVKIVKTMDLKSIAKLRPDAVVVSVTANVQGEAAKLRKKFAGNIKIYDINEIISAYMPVSL
ncbi:MAG: class I SAM-dependent methyltransferase [Planctomycetes bacterium]|nr:class I SAM-dependent methyltransferase [Planctomycetota bacterium]